MAKKSLNLLKPGGFWWWAASFQPGSSLSWTESWPLWRSCRCRRPGFRNFRIWGNCQVRIGWRKRCDCATCASLEICLPEISTLQAQGLWLLSTRPCRDALGCNHRCSYNLGDGRRRETNPSGRRKSRITDFRSSFKFLSIFTFWFY